IRIMNGTYLNLTPIFALRIANALCNSMVLYTLPFMLRLNTKRERKYITMQASYAKASLGLLKNSNPILSINETAEKPLLLQAEQRLQNYFARVKYYMPNHKILEKLHSES